MFKVALRITEAPNDAAGFCDWETTGMSTEESVFQWQWEPAAEAGMVSVRHKRKQKAKRRRESTDACMTGIPNKKRKALEHSK